MKRVFICLCTIFFLTGFSAAQQIDYAVIPESPRPGEPVTIGAAAGTAGGAKQAVLVAGGKRLAKADFFFIPAEDGRPAFMAAVLAIPSTVSPGTAAIRLENEKGAVGEIPLNIQGRKFVSEIIELNQVLTGIRADPDPQKTAESNALWAILNKTGNDVYHTGVFKAPVQSTRRTSFFGDRRVYKYSNGRSDTSIHAGIDFGVPTGTQIGACGAGKVVLARMRIVTGNSVVIEHLPGIYSLYYHLDKIDVAEGAMVEEGEVIGLSGSTGLATGPHLHWEVRVYGENTDPDAFIARPILDKISILGRISSWRPPQSTPASLTDYFADRRD